MTSELFTVYGKFPDSYASGATSNVAVLYSDLWYNPTTGTSGGVWYIRLPQGTKMKVWDTKLIDTTPNQVLNVYLAVQDDISSSATAIPTDGSISGWVIKGRDTLANWASGAIAYNAVYTKERCARPEHIIESPDGLKNVAFLINQSVSGIPNIQYTLEITDDEDGRNR